MSTGVLLAVVISTAVIVAFLLIIICTVFAGTLTRPPMSPRESLSLLWWKIKERYNDLVNGWKETL